LEADYNREVPLAHSIGVEKELRRPNFLVFVNAVVQLDDRDVDFEGEIVLGVNDEEANKLHLWRANFADGKRVQAGYVDGIFKLPSPPYFGFVINERSADAILERDMKDTKGAKRIGDMELYAKFVRHYMESG